MLNIATKAPVTAEPAHNEGITLNGSSIINGIAPSVIPASPKIQVDLPISCSSLLKYFLANKVAKVTPNAETIFTDAKAAYGIIIPSVIAPTQNV